MKDALGNDLHEGDLVAVQLDRPLVYGRIAKIEEGGVIAGINKRGESQVRPGLVLIESRHILNVDPRALVSAVLALRDDKVPAPDHILEN
jgi:hypothetical protein